jgi:hypothetical protein
MLVKLPFPVPSDVLLFAIVGFCKVFQQIPLSFTVALPSEVILPPQVAVDCKTLVASFVVSMEKSHELYTMLCFFLQSIVIATVLSRRTDLLF